MKRDSAIISNKKQSLVIILLKREEDGLFNSQESKKVVSERYGYLKW